MDGYAPERFVGETSPGGQSLMCSICLGILRNPADTPCQHMFCWACITLQINTSGECPTCRGTLSLESLKSPHLFVRNVLNGLKIRCDNSDAGCAEIVTLDQLENHTATCGMSQRPSFIHGPTVSTPLCRITSETPYDASVKS